MLTPVEQESDEDGERTERQEEPLPTETLSVIVQWHFVSHITMAHIYRRLASTLMTPQLESLYMRKRVSKGDYRSVIHFQLDFPRKSLVCPSQ